MGWLRNVFELWSGNILKAIIWKTDNEAQYDNKISLSERILKVEKGVNNEEKCQKLRQIDGKREQKK